MAKASTSEASRFRVERKGPFSVASNKQGWIVFHHASPGKNDFGWLHRDGFFIDITSVAWKQVVDGAHFPTKAEATFRLALYTDRGAVLAQWGFKADTPLGIVADALEGCGLEMQIGVLRQVSQGEGT